MSFNVTLDHIGIAVPQFNPSSEGDLSRLFKILGVQMGLSEQVPEQGVHVHFYGLQGTPPHLELLEVSDPQGSVAKFIEKRGPGIHHLSFKVEQGTLDRICEQLKEEKFKLIYDAPKKGAQNMRINFIHPATAGGVLIELMEKASEG